MNYFYSVGRDEIERKDFSEIHYLIKQLEEYKSNAFQMLVLSFGGYDQDYREVYEIEEIRDYVDQLFEMFPYILYFIDFEMEIQNYLLPCICDIEVMYRGKIYSYEEILEMHLKGEEIPDKTIRMNISDDKLNRIKKGLKEYGERINDRKNADRIIHFLNVSFNQ